MNKLGLLALSSVASLVFVAGCAAEPAGDSAESSSQDLAGPGVSSAYTTTSKDSPLDGCTFVSEGKDEEGGGSRYQCGEMGGYTLFAAEYEETAIAPLVRTPSGTFELDVWSAGVDTHYGYMGKLAEWRGRGVALGKVEPTALIMRVFTPGVTEDEGSHYGEFTGSNSLVIVKLSPDGACVHSAISGAVANHNQLARDVADSQAFQDFQCPASTPEPLAATSKCGTLKANEGLGFDQALTSCSGSHSLVMQSDGNLALYNNRSQVATWSSQTANTSSQAAILRADGQLGVFERGLSATFATPTTGNPGATLALQDDGNLVIYAADGHALWSTGTQGK